MQAELVEKLKQSSEKLLEFIEKSSEATLDFTKEQVPLVVQEVLNWGFYSNLAYTIISLLFFITFAVITLKSYKTLFSEKWNDAAPGFMLIIPLIAGLGASITPFILHGMLCIKICVAPRLYLLESLREIIK